jgi:hypothetical protein
MWKARHNEFNPSIMFVPRKTSTFILTVCAYGMFNKVETIVLYLFVLFLSPANLQTVLP